MKVIGYLCIVLIIFSCSSTKKLLNDNTDNHSYLIKKINVKNSWYIIYAERHDSLYKIVVGKEEKVNKNCNKIIVGSYYDLNLQSRSENVPVIGGVKLKPANNLDVECYAYDAETEICIEPKKGIFDLYSTEDLKGLCYTPNSR